MAVLDILLVILLVVGMLVIYLLFARLVLEISSPHQTMGFRIGRIASATLCEDYSTLELRIAWWKRRYDITDMAGTGNSLTEHKSRAGAPRRKIKIDMAAIKRVVRSFRISRCRIEIDTGDMPLNGCLFPLFYAFRYWSGREVGINFCGRNTIILRIENTLARMLWAYIKS